MKDKEASPPARLLVVDDHALVREGTQVMLAKEPDIEVVGEAENGREALELCRFLRPKLVLMDVRMPEMDGLAATRTIKQEYPEISVLILTSHESEDYLVDAIRAGAAGYVLKEATKRQLLGAIRRTLRGESPLNQELAMRLLTRLLDDAPKEEPADLDASFGKPPGEHPGPNLPGSLTPREVEVLWLLAQGQHNQQIAHDLLISTSTVKKHVSQILSKLEASDRTQAVVKAIKLGLLPKQRRG